jgi:hypothetical protein
MNQAWTSTVVMAASEMIIPSTPVRRFCRFSTIFGSKEPSRSQVTATRQRPARPGSYWSSIILHDR